MSHDRLGGFSKEEVDFNSRSSEGRHVPDEVIVSEFLLWRASRTEATRVCALERSAKVREFTGPMRRLRDWAW